jgi:NAD(P)-dependent dehydrogenase (short-subunit alcohol dehydrogenase family)
LEFIPLDLSSFDSIEEFTKQLESKNYKIDLLVNNAGLMFTEYTLTRDGFEMQMGVNHFGHFKLTMLLLPLLVENSRVLTVTSITCLSGTLLFITHLFHRCVLYVLTWLNSIGTINFSDINASRSYSKFRAYANSKLANIHFTKELARRLKASNKDIVAYGINPGSVHTNIVSSMPWFLGKLHSTFGPYLLKTPFEGSATAIFAAISDDIGKKESGETFFEAKISHTPVSDSIESRNIGKKLWEMSEELTHSKYIW